MVVAVETEARAAEDIDSGRESAGRTPRIGSPNPSSPLAESATPPRIGLQIDLYCEYGPALKALYKQDGAWYSCVVAEANEDESKWRVEFVGADADEDDEWLDLRTQRWQPRVASDKSHDESNDESQR